MRLSPLDPLAYLCKAGLALAHMVARRYSDGIDWVDQALREQPGYAAAVRYKASLCGLLGRTDEGREWVRRMLELYPNLTIASLERYLTSMNVPELAAIFLEGMHKAGLPEE